MYGQKTRKLPLKVGATGTVFIYVWSLQGAVRRAALGSLRLPR